MRPKLPWGRRPRKPGVGLEQVFDATPPVEPETLTTCPRCEGSTFQEIVPQAPLDAPNVRSFGEYRVIMCEDCNGAGVVTARKAAEIRARRKP